MYEGFTPAPSASVQQMAETELFLLCNFFLYCNIFVALCSLLDDSIDKYYKSMVTKQ